MKVIGLGSPDDLRVRFDASEVDVLVDVLRDLRAKATRDAAETYATTPAGETRPIDDRHDRLRGLEGLLMQLEEQPPDNRPGAILIGDTTLMRDVARAGAQEALDRLQDSHERCGRRTRRHQPAPSPRSARPARADAHGARALGERRADRGQRIDLARAATHPRAVGDRPPRPPLRPPGAGLPATSRRRHARSRSAHQRAATRVRSIPTAQLLLHSTAPFGAARVRGASQAWAPRSRSGMAPRSAVNACSSRRRITAPAASMVRETKEMTTMHDSLARGIDQPHTGRLGEGIEQVPDARSKRRRVMSTLPPAARDTRSDVAPQQKGPQMFRRLLVAYDDSLHAQAALAGAVELARATDGRLTIFSVAPEPALWGMGGEYWAPVNAEEFGAQLERAYQGMLDGAVETVPADVPVTKLLAHGAAGAAIVEEAANGHDLVVMGSRGRGGLHSLLLGSVSHHVLQASPVPVLVVHLAPDARAGDDQSSPPAVETNSAPVGA